MLTNTTLELTKDFADFFEVFYSRKENQNIKMETEVKTVTNIDDTEKYEMWKEKVNKVLNEAKEKQKNKKCNGHQTFIEKSTIRI